MVAEIVYKSSLARVGRASPGLSVAGRPITLPAWVLRVQMWGRIGEGRGLVLQLV